MVFYEYKPDSRCYNIYNYNQHSIYLESYFKGVKGNKTDIGEKIS
jgi:hypothetical protein